MRAEDVHEGAWKTKQLGRSDEENKTNFKWHVKPSPQVSDKTLVTSHLLLGHHWL